VGDVEFESVRRVASAITPVPGGVGPLTNALLLAHLVRAARGQEATIVPPVAPAEASAVAGATVSDDAVVASRGVR
jgi:hypothetical protein